MRVESYVKLLLVGHGKMGRMVESLAGEYGAEIAGVIDPGSPAHGGGPDADRWSGADVAIDFSTPDSVTTNVPVLASIIVFCALPGLQEVPLGTLEGLQVPSPESHRPTMHLLSLRLVQSFGVPEHTPAAQVPEVKQPVTPHAPPAVGV